jgi:hypothetical protein
VPPTLAPCPSGTLLATALADEDGTVYSPVASPDAAVKLFLEDFLPGQHVEFDLVPSGDVQAWGVSHPPAVAVVVHVVETGTGWVPLDLTYCAGGAGG